MSTEYEIEDTLDARGLNCPMPVIETKQAVDGLADGEVLEVIATDPGSMPDIEEWAAGTPGVTLLDQREGEMDGETVYTHYVRAGE